MTKWIHKLSNIDLENREADCANCGRVGIRVKKNHSPRCIVVHREEKKRYSVYKYRDKHPGRPETCEVCGTTERICWDHDHQTGEHRGWLCSNCNSALGFAKDDIETLKGLIEYIQK